MRTCVPPIYRTFQSRLPGTPPNEGYGPLESTVLILPKSASVCHLPDRANRPDQKSFCCGACGFQTHADLNAAENIKRRAGDAALQACKNKGEVKALLLERHEAWKTRNGCP